MIGLLLPPADASAGAASPGGTTSKAATSVAASPGQGGFQSLFEAAVRPPVDGVTTAPSDAASTLRPPGVTGGKVDSSLLPGGLALLGGRAETEIAAVDSGLGDAGRTSVPRTFPGLAAATSTTGIRPTPALVDLTRTAAESESIDAAASSGVDGTATPDDRSGAGEVGLTSPQFLPTAGGGRQTLAPFESPSQPSASSGGSSGAAAAASGLPADRRDGSPPRRLRPSIDTPSLDVDTSAPDGPADAPGRLTPVGLSPEIRPASPASDTDGPTPQTPPSGPAFPARPAGEPSSAGRVPGSGAATPQPQGRGLDRPDESDLAAPPRRPGSSVPAQAPPASAPKLPSGRPFRPPGGAAVRLVAEPTSGGPAEAPLRPSETPPTAAAAAFAPRLAAALTPSAEPPPVGDGAPFSPSTPVAPDPAVSDPTVPDRPDLGRAASAAVDRASSSQAHETAVPAPPRRPASRPTVRVGRAAPTVKIATEPASETRAFDSIGEVLSPGLSLVAPEASNIVGGSRSSAGPEGLSGTGVRPPADGGGRIALATGGLGAGLSPSPPVPSAQRASDPVAAAVPETASAGGAVPNESARPVAVASPLEEPGAAASENLEPAAEPSAEPSAGPRAEPAPRAGRSAERVGSDVADAVAEATQTRAQPLRVRLDPPELGGVSVEAHREGGRLSVRLAFESPEAARLAGESLPALRESLLARGVDAGDLDITVAVEKPSDRAAERADATSDRGEDRGGESRSFDQHRREDGPSDRRRPDESVPLARRRGPSEAAEAEPVRRTAARTAAAAGGLDIEV